MATGWHAAVAAGVTPGGTAVVVGDGAVGLCGVLAAAQLGAERVIAMSRHEPRQEIARQFGATDIVAERGKEGAARIEEITGGVGADAVLECVGTDEAMKTAFAVARPGRDGRLRRRAARRGAAGAPDVPARTSAWPAAWRRCAATCPSCSSWSLAGAIDPGLVFDLTLPLDEVAEGYRAMDERRAIKVLLEP